MRIASLSEAEKILERYIPLVHEMTGKDLTLKRMAPLMEFLGHPERKLKIIHVAGTSGKTSTAYFIAGLLKAAGEKVGLTISPYMDVLTERVQVNLEPIEESEFCAGLGEFMDLLTASQIEPTYFELLTAFVYWYFAKIKVDYAVIETGLGGLHDGTNVADNPDKVCVITDIGYDHMNVLGKTLPEIASQKAGIIHPNNYALMYRQPDEVIGVIQDWCRNHQAELHFHEQIELENNFPEPKLLTSLPAFQVRNFLLAHQSYLVVKERDGLRELSPEMLEEAIATRVPGRMESIRIKGKTIIMDGAHNVQKMQAFVSSFQKLMPGQKADIVLAMKKGKDYLKVLPIVEPICKSLILTSFSVMQDRPNKSVNAAKYLKVAKAAGFTNIINEPDTKAAYQLLLKSPEKVGIITGSLFLLSQLRRDNKELKQNKS